MAVASDPTRFYGNVQYSDELAAEICAHIASGGSLRRYCYGHTTRNALKNPIAGRPATMTVYRWLRDRPDFLAMYNVARSDQADTLADEIIDIAENEDIDIKTRRLMIDSFKWTASKLRPKKYGDRVAIAGDDESPLKVSSDLQTLTDEELHAIASIATGVIKKE